MTFTREQLKKFDKEFLIEIILKQSEQLAEMNRKLDLLIEQAAIGNQQRFGRSSEKNLADEEQITMFFNETEALCDSAAEEPVIEEVVPSYTRRKKSKGKRDEDLKDFPVREEIHELSDEVLTELFPDGYRYLPDEIYRKLEMHPARFEVVEHHIKVYRGKRSQKVVKAEHPKEMLDNSIATPSVVSAVINAKYVNSVPLYRQEQELQRNDVHISRQTMANWMMTVSERYLSLLYDCMKEEILSSSVIHADETPVMVSKDGRDTMQKSYMWVYRTGTMCGAHPAILYDYQKTRKMDAPREFLQDYTGTLVCDGYQVYHSLGKKRADELKVSGCWAHARRKFADICKSLGKEQSKGTLANHALVLIAQIYHADNKLQTLAPEERLRKRQKEVKPLVDAFFAWLKERQAELPEKSATAAGFTYCLNQETYLRVFLDNPAVPLDNNAAEIAIRPFCVGKNNWKLIDTVNGAKASAILYSIAETAKANNLKPYDYFKHLLTEIPKHMEETSLDFIQSLLPWSEQLPAECKKKAEKET